MYFRGKRSKLGAKISFAFLLGVFSTGCGLSWNDEATHSDSFEVRSDLKDCGQDFDRKVADYFEGKTSAQEMLDLGECADKALSLFLEHHRGEKENAFSVEKELYSSFIKRYFLGETEVPKSLRKALMKFKVSLMGGNEQEFTREELEHLRLIARTTAQAAAILQPYMPLRTGEAKQFSDEKLDASIIALGEAGALLGRVIQPRTPPVVSNYSSESFQQLLEEFHSFFYKETQEGPFQVLLEHLETAKALKGVLIRPPFDHFQTGDWSTVLVEGAQWYGIVLRLMQLQHNDTKLSHGAGLGHLKKLADSGVGLIKSAIDRHPGQRIHFTDFNRLLDQALNYEELFPFFDFHRNGKERSQEIKEVVKSTFNNVFKELGRIEVDQDRESVTGVSKEMLDGVWDPFYRWYQRQVLFEDVFVALGASKFFHGEGFRKTELLKQLSSTQQKLEIERDSFVQDTTGIHVNAVSGARSIIEDHLALFREEDSEILFRWSHEIPVEHEGYEPGHTQVTLEENTHRSFAHLTRLNWMNAIFESWIGAYGYTNPNQGLTRSEFHRSYMDIRDLGIELKVFDKRLKTSAKKRFLEANLFLYPSDGDDFVNLLEGTELVAFLLSAKLLSNRIFEILVGPEEEGGACEVAPEPSWNGFAQPILECFREHYFSNIDEEAGSNSYLARLPGFRDFYLSLNETNQLHLERTLLDIARRDENEEKKLEWIERGEIESLTTVTHYVEALLSVFDLSRDGIIDTDESEAAFHRFQHTLEEFEYCDGGTKKKVGKNAKLVFKYILIKGEIPDSSKLARFVLFGGTKRPIRADRARIATILSLFQEFRKKQAEGCK